VQRLRFPNFASTTDRVSLQFNDFTGTGTRLHGRPPGGPPGLTHAAGRGHARLR
jgi:hypothetical protein